MSDLDTRIDQLYALPAGEFVAARTALAKSLKGEDAARVKRLQKPTSVPWAVNQIYWHDRPRYETLMAAGRALRTAQVAALQGQPADLKAAAAAHRAAIGDAVAAAVNRAAAASISPSTDALSRMLEAISLSAGPAPEPGRFTDIVGPQGFEALAGIAPLPPAGATGSRDHRPATGTTRTPSAAEKRRLEAEAAAARDAAERAVAVATRELREAEQRETRVQAQVEFARQQLERSEASLKDAGAAVVAAAAALARAEAERDRL